MDREVIQQKSHEFIGSDNPLMWLEQWHVDEYRDVPIFTIQGRDLIALYAAEMCIKHAADIQARLDIAEKTLSEIGGKITEIDSMPEGSHCWTIFCHWWKEEKSK